jgi:DNA-binding CsgD family transcriptional regulator
MTAKEAARQLRITSGTINEHLKNIYAKTGTSSRGQLQHLLALDAASARTLS